MELYAATSNVQVGPQNEHVDLAENDYAYLLHLRVFPVNHSGKERSVGGSE